MADIYAGVVDTSYNVDTVGTVPTDVAAAGTSGNEVTAPDSWGGLFQSLVKQGFGAAIAKDQALTQAQVNRQTAMRQLPDGRYVPASAGLSMGTLLLIGGAIVGGVLLVKLAK